MLLLHSIKQTDVSFVKSVFFFFFFVKLVFQIIINENGQSLFYNTNTPIKQLY